MERGGKARDGMGLVGRDWLPALKIIRPRTPLRAGGVDRFATLRIAAAAAITPILPTDDGAHRRTHDM